MPKICALLLVYEDFRRFFQRLRRAFPEISGYLAAAEPQRRGAWHMHVFSIVAEKIASIYQIKGCVLCGVGGLQSAACGMFATWGSTSRRIFPISRTARELKRGLGSVCTRSASALLGGLKAWPPRKKTSFYGNFGDYFRDLDDYSLCTISRTILRKSTASDSFPGCFILF